MFERLTEFIDKIEKDNIGEVVVDRTGDGTPENPIHFPYVNYSRVVGEFEEVVYEFEHNHPEFELTQYTKILEKYNVEWGTKSMEAADVQKMDAQGVMALLMGAIRAERFCDGALLGFFRSGAVEKWLLRLKELDK